VTEFKNNLQSYYSVCYFKNYVKIFLVLNAVSFLLNLTFMLNLNFSMASIKNIIYAINFVFHADLDNISRENGQVFLCVEQSTLRVGS